MESQQTTNDGRQSAVTRVGGACFVCRAKKRKCSGRKPRCDQCKSSGLHCVWPKQQKRGLPKHFVRKLESRLWRTETLLKSILPCISDEQLESTLRGLNLPATEKHYLDKDNADPKVWELFPLTTLSNVREWQTLTTSREPSAAGQFAEEDSPQEEMETGGSRSGSEPPIRVSEQDARAPTGRIVSSQNAMNEAHMMFQPAQGSSHSIVYQGGDIDPPANIQDMEEGNSSLLPESFQKQFLW